MTIRLPDAPTASPHQVRVAFLISANVWQRFQKAADERCVSANWLANRALEAALTEDHDHRAGGV